MNIYLIHGDNSLASYNRLQEYTNKGRNKGWEVAEVAEKSSNISAILRSNSLFKGKRLIIVRDYKLLSEQAIEFIYTSNEDAEIIIYHVGTIPALFIKKLPVVSKNEVFDLSKSLWKFIENFYPGNLIPCLTYFHESIKHDPVELVFSILIGQIRDIYLILNSEILPYPAWRLQKLRKISDKFGKYRIKKVIKELSEIDIKIKTSNANLKEELDLFIIRKLK